MSKFELAFNYTLGEEGGWGNDPADPGGATKYGVSLRFLRAHEPVRGDLDGDGDIDAQDIWLITPTHAASWYEEHFWQKAYESLPTSVAIRTFDHAVNAGWISAGRCLQRAVRSFEIPIEDDGLIGPKTLEAIKKVPELPLLTAFRSERAAYYRVITALNPRFSKFINGWLNRAYR